MARKPRIEYCGALYHVLSRGNQKRPTFRTAKDYEDYLGRLWRYHEKFGFVLYAYCLMPNHIHLLIEARDVPLSKIMQAVQFSYTQSFNRRHKTVGHLFQGRYKAILCQHDEYLLELVRYIHLNPVRAKLAKNPRDYKWSSHRALLELEKEPRCDVSAVLDLFGKRHKEAAKRYEAFVLEAIGMGHRKEFYQVKDQRVLGEDKFIAKTLAKEENEHSGKIFYKVSLQEIIDAVAREWDIPPGMILSPRRSRLGSFARSMIAVLAKSVSGMTMKEVGRHFSKGESAMAHRYRALEENFAQDTGLLKRWRRLHDLLIAGKPRKICLNAYPKNK
ncbi:MAG: hypothetical protein A3H42_03760 [Deltaproteobacteria bacterium RIFCSPLOWO2_02_FULL_46_8]|nr:MAG: hypothetical protein A3H42_03760 [Deltaproteobacteria bacterium RIFCSPLOWO2_02_FULL_46_8]